MQSIISKYYSIAKKGYIMHIILVTFSQGHMDLWIKQIYHNELALQHSLIQQSNILFVTALLESIDLTVKINKAISKSYISYIVGAVSK